MTLSRGLKIVLADELFGDAPTPTTPVDITSWSIGKFYLPYDNSRTQIVVGDVEHTLLAGSVTGIHADGLTPIEPLIVKVHGAHFEQMIDGKPAGWMVYVSDRKANVYLTPWEPGNLYNQWEIALAARRQRWSEMISEHLLFNVAEDQQQAELTRLTTPIVEPAAPVVVQLPLPIEPKAKGRGFVPHSYRN